MENSSAPKPGNNKRRFNFYWIYIILTIVLFALYFSGRNETPKEEIEMGQLIELLQQGEVSKIELVNKESADIYLNEKGLKKHFPDAKPSVKGTSPTANYSYQIGSLERFEEKVEQVGSMSSSSVGFRSSS